MDDAVRERLAELIAEHGRSVCASPRAVGMMLRQVCPNADGPIRELELALSNGCIEPLLESLPELADGPALVQKFVDSFGLPIERAQWVIETWTVALMREKPESSGLKRDWSQWNRLDVSALTGSGVGLYQRSMANLFIVTAAGALGGAALGLGVWIREDWRTLPFVKDGIEDLPAWAREISLIVLGVLGGGTGGLLGWVLGGGRDPASGLRCGIAAAWAFLGGFGGAAGGLAAFGLIGVSMGSLLVAFLGAVVGVFAGRVLSRLWT